MTPIHCLQSNPNNYQYLPSCKFTLTTLKTIPKFAPGQQTVYVVTSEPFFGLCQDQAPRQVWCLCQRSSSLSRKMWIPPHPLINTTMGTQHKARDQLGLRDPGWNTNAGVWKRSRPHFSTHRVHFIPFYHWNDFTENAYTKPTHMTLSKLRVFTCCVEATFVQTCLKLYAP